VSQDLLQLSNASYLLANTKLCQLRDCSLSDVLSRDGDEACATPPYVGALDVVAEMREA
jgi:hypothetical protein